jgi:hypothetical protein
MTLFISLQIREKNTEGETNLDPSGTERMESEYRSIAKRQADEYLTAASTFHAVSYFSNLHRTGKV